jgi:hypothetical protein
MAPALALSIGVAMVLVGLMGILTLRRFVRFVAAALARDAAEGLSHPGRAIFM